MLTFLFLCVFGGKTRRRVMAETLADNNRQLAALHAHYRADAICFDRMMANWNEKLYPDYRKQLNEQRAALGLPSM